MNIKPTLLIDTTAANLLHP